MNEMQRTIGKSVRVSGVGLHSGKQVTLTFLPSEGNTGYRFKRVDMENQPIIEALAENVVDTSRGTTIANGKAMVATIEHVLAALVGCNLDNVLIEIDGEETPILDGSSILYVEALKEAGSVEQEVEREYIELESNVNYTNGNGTEMIAIPAEKFSVSTMIDYNSKVLGTQHASLNSIDEFNDEFASCKTFVFLHEMEPLIKMGLIKGGDLENAIVYVEKFIEQEELDRLAEFFNKPKVVVLEQGNLNNVELKYQNEAARHKLLDVVGDLALVGKPLKARIFSTRPGHENNVKFAKLIREQYLGAIENKIPVYDPEKEPLYDINDIMKMLPHRYPFLLVDKVLEMGDDYITGIKNITMDEPFFTGHFPDEPVMPGVLQIEALAQCGGIFALSTVENPEDYSTYFMKLENVRFRKKVIPGDTLVFRLELKSPIRRGLCHMYGTAYVGSQVVMEGEMLAQILKNK
jgi:UDP-3-O-[3-hydroxymyristoyl] N-acetylglucosamine deacetylase/3-hydroxyacyl-[acyl-carrier-protein] dehydratase